MLPNEQLELSGTLSLTFTKAKYKHLGVKSRILLFQFSTKYRNTFSHTSQIYIVGEGNPSKGGLKIGSVIVRF